MEICGKIVKFYKYRKATVKNIFCKIEMTKDIYEDIEKWISKNGYKIDNHIVMEIQDKIYIGIADNNILFGTSVIEGSW